MAPLTPPIVHIPSAPTSNAERRPRYPCASLVVETTGAPVESAMLAKNVLTNASASRQIGHWPAGDGMLPGQLFGSAPVSDRAIGEEASGG